MENQGPKGFFMTIFSSVKDRKRIFECVNSLPESINIFFQDSEWIQKLDYEHVPFHYRKFHEHGHLFQDYPINIPKKVDKGKAPVDQEGFLNVPNKKKSNKKSTILIPSTQATSNQNNLKNMMDKVEDLP
jgi:hypothetical protein